MHNNILSREHVICTHLCVSYVFMCCNLCVCVCTIPIQHTHTKARALTCVYRKDVLSCDLCVCVYNTNTTYTHIQARALTCVYRKEVLSCVAGKLSAADKRLLNSVQVCKYVSVCVCITMTTYIYIRFHRHTCMHNCQNNF